jgi:hypothetical protein
MTDQHPITPPPELVEQWIAEIWHEGTPVRVAASDLRVTTRAARWGADQELEACCAWVGDGKRENLSQVIALRDHRRPKPPSLKVQALCHLESFACSIETLGMDSDLIRRALESLPD